MNDNTTVVSSCMRTHNPEPLPFIKPPLSYSHQLPLAFVAAVDSTITFTSTSSTSTPFASFILSTLLLSPRQARVLQAKELNTEKQQSLAFQRIAAIQEVLEAARPVVKALKLERKARVGCIF